MWYIKNKSTGKYWYDYVCGCHVWKTLLRSNGWSTYEQALYVVSDLGIDDEVDIILINEEGE